MKTKNLIPIALFAGLSAVSAQFTLPTPIPITLQTIVVLLSGLLLGGRRGAMSQAVYTSMGLVGLPVFSGGRGGLGIVSTPSFGYILGFILCAYVVGKLSHALRKVRGQLIWSCVAGMLVVHVVGLPYAYAVLTYIMEQPVEILAFLKSWLLVFLPWDTVKTLVAILISSVFMKRLGTLR